MYLPEKKKAEIRKCLKKIQSSSKVTKINVIKGIYDTEDGRKVSQALFDARDGKEVFTPF